MIVRAALIASLLLAAHALLPAAGHAYCRTATPVWDDAHPVRVVIGPGMENYIRHPYRDASGTPVSNQSCTTSATCGPDGFCAMGFPSAPVNRCVGPRWTRTELERSVQWVLGRINNEVGADIPFAYLDTTNTAACPIEDVCGDAARPWMDCFQSETIVITASMCNQTAINSAYWNGTQWVDDNASGHRAKLLRVWVSLNAGNVPYNGVIWTHGLGAAANLEGTLLHELGHGLGLGHVVNDYPWQYPTCVPDTSLPTNTVCPAGPDGTCAIMANSQGESSGLNAHFLGYDDIEGLVAIYGVESAPATRLFEDWDLSSANFTELSTADLPLVTDLGAAAVPSTGATVVTFGGRFRSALFMERFRMYEWSWLNYTSTETTIIDSPGYRSTGPIGVSMSSTHRTLSSHPMRLTDDSRRYRRRLYDARHPVGGGTIPRYTTNPAPTGAGDDTAVPGVSTAFDPTSGATLHAIRSPTGEILLIGWRSGTGFSNVVFTGVRSFAHPSIACSPTRCFAALVEMPWPVTASSQTRLQWIEFSFDWPTGGSAGFTNISGVNTAAYNITSDPVAAVVWRPSGGWYFYVTVSVPSLIGSTWGTRLYTYRHTEGSTGLSVLLPQVVDFPGVAVQPAAAGTGGYAEIFATLSY